MAQPFLSIIIPAYNEELRLRPSLERIAGYFAQQDYPVEIVVVDDGSRDATCRVVEEFATESAVPVRLERNPRNAGKGAAVQRGMLLADGQYLLFSDADLSTPIECIEAFLPALKSGHEVVIGTRKTHGAVITKQQPWLRRNMAKVFVVLANSLLGMHLTDFTCGFKAFSQRAGKEIFSRMMVQGWSFDAEILFIAKSLDYSIVEVPVTWAHAEGSQIRLKRDVLRSFTGLLEIRRNGKEGKYSASTEVRVP